MDYQIVFKPHHLLVIIVLLIFSFLPYSLAIVNRDLVLTPKQGLQLSGKRIFYEESTNNNDALHNNDTAARPWERTLKHVIYLTLFTNAPNGIITGNFSKVKEYNEFLKSSYVRSLQPHDSRFGDIVTLAQGRLEAMPNGSHRFVEGNCDYECVRDSHIVAIWHVQKIRHRDTADRKYHYEMKFSVSPWTAKTLTETVVRGGPNKRTVMDEKRSNMQTFIQKEDDYPHSFSKMVPGNDKEFADRRFDATRNFRQVNQNHQPQQQVTPIPQSTFLRGVYHPHPPPIPPQQVPLPDRLNIGEYYKGNYIPKGTSRIELFPNLLNMMIGKRQNFLSQPTTFQPPTHQMKFHRPEIYTLPQHQVQEFPKFPEYHHHSQEHFTQKGPTQNPIVSHHYHHFFMPNNSAVANNEQAIHHSGEHKVVNHPDLYQNEVTEVVTPSPFTTNLYDQHTTTLRQHNFPQHHYQQQPNYNQLPEHMPPASQNYNQLPEHMPPASQNYHHLQVRVHMQQPDPQNYIYIQEHTPPASQNYNQLQEHMPPAPQKFIFPPTQIEQHRVVHVTPAPPLRKPQYEHYYQNRPFTMQPEYTTAHVPLFISYPAPVNEEERADNPTPRNKPFSQSETVDDTIHYSEPDPLYAHTTNQEEEEKYNSAGEEHVDSQEPQLESPEHYDHHHDEGEKDNNKEHTDQVEAQLLPPNENEDGQHQADQAEINADSAQSQTKQNHIEQKTSQTSSTSVKISTERTTSNTIKTEASNAILTTTIKPKPFPSRVQRISLKTATTTSSSTKTTPKPKSTKTKTTNPKSSSTKSTTTTTTENEKLSTTSKPRKHFVSTSSTESPLRSLSRYRNPNSRTSTSTTTTEKPVIKWKPKRRTSNGKSMKNITQESQVKDVDIDDEADDIGAKESNHQVTKLYMSPSTTTEMEPEPTTEMSNDITTSTSTISSLQLPTQSPMTTQSLTEIYEILTQKSVSKSISLKVGSHGEEIPIVINEEENEVKNV